MVTLYKRIEASEAFIAAYQKKQDKQLLARELLPEPLKCYQRIYQDFFDSALKLNVRYSTDAFVSFTLDEKGKRCYQAIDNKRTHLGSKKIQRITITFFCGASLYQKCSFEKDENLTRVKAYHISSSKRLTNLADIAYQVACIPLADISMKAIGLTIISTIKTAIEILLLIAFLGITIGYLIRADLKSANYYYSAFKNLITITVHDVSMTAIAAAAGTFGSLICRIITIAADIYGLIYAKSNLPEAIRYYIDATPQLLPVRAENAPGEPAV